MIYHRTANHKGVAEMHAWHRRQRIDIITTHPDACRVVMPDRVQKAVFRWEQSGRHAWVESEGQEGEQIREGQCSTNSCECGVRWGDVIVPGDEAIGRVSICSCLFESASFANPTVPGI